VKQTNKVAPLTLTPNQLTIASANAGIECARLQIEDAEEDGDREAGAAALAAEWYFLGAYDHLSCASGTNRKRSLRDAHAVGCAESYTDGVVAAMLGKRR